MTGLLTFPTNTTVTVMWNQPDSSYSDDCTYMYTVVYKYAHVRSVVHTRQKLFQLKNIPPKTLVLFCVRAMSYCGIHSQGTTIATTTSKIFGVSFRT